MQANLIINNEEITIRPLSTNDVSSYVNLCPLLMKEDKTNLIIKYKKKIKEHKEDDPNLLFAVLYKGKIAGAVATQCQNCDAVVIVDIPKETSITDEVKKLFIQLCKKTQLYDNIKFGRQISNATVDVNCAQEIACYQSTTTSV